MAQATGALEKAQQAVIENSYDADAWTFILDDAKKKSLTAARDAYERVLKVFPTASQMWFDYASLELRHRQFDQLESIFKRCLITVPNLQLYQLYIDYLKQAGKSREGITKAYEWTLDNLTADVATRPFWEDYIKYLEAEPMSSTATAFHHSQKTTTIRKAYQASVIGPKTGLDVLWQAYTTFEMSTNKVVGKRALDEVRDKYMQARNVTREIELITRGIDMHQLALPASANELTLKQKRLWEQWIELEKANPLRYEDPTAVVKRVVAVYQQFVLRFCFYTDVWYNAAMYLDQAATSAQARSDTQASQRFASEARKHFERGISYNPTDVLLSFAYADYLEAAGRADEAKKVYEALLTQESIDPTLVFVQYMKMTRRVHGIKAVRNVFKQARKNDKCKYQVYVASAMIELTSTDKGPSVCQKVFELGLRHHANQPGFARAYIDFLTSLGDSANTRALYERVLKAIPDEQADSIFVKYLEFESLHGELADVLKVEGRRGDVLRKIKPDGNFEERKGATLSDLLLRYRYHDLLPCRQDLVSVYAPDSASIITPELIQASNNGASATGALVSTSGVRFSDYPLPDIEQLTAYKPSLDNDVALRVVRPGSLIALMKQLPPPDYYSGPKVKVDMLIKEISGRAVPQPRMANIADAAPDHTSAKRQSSEQDDVEDVFRQRQRIKHNY